MQSLVLGLLCKVFCYCEIRNNVLKGNLGLLCKVFCNCEIRNNVQKGKGEYS